MSRVIIDDTSLVPALVKLAEANALRRAAVVRLKDAVRTPGEADALAAFNEARANAIDAERVVAMYAEFALRDATPAPEGA